MTPALAARLPLMPLAIAGWLLAGPAIAATESETDERSAAQAESSENPMEAVENAEKGSLTNPYSTSDSDVVAG